MTNSTTTAAESPRNSATDYLRAEGAAERARQRVEREFAARVGVSVETLRALITKSVQHPGATWAL